MIEINIPEMHIQEIEKLIQDDWIKREMKYESVDDFIICAIESCIEADKDAACLPLH